MGSIDRVGRPNLASVRWQPGDAILWCYLQGVDPVRVVRDDERGLVVWLAPGTSILRPVPADGLPLRDRPPGRRFTDPRMFKVLAWTGDGILRIAPPGAAHSVWLFRSPDLSGEFSGWYANLEDPLVRRADSVHTRDHILDVWMAADGTIRWKDEDELAAAVEVGKRTQAEADACRAEGERVMAAMARRAAPYDGEWLDWRPDPGWTVPDLPDRFRVLDGQPVTIFADERLPVEN